MDEFSHAGNSVVFAQTSWLHPMQVILEDLTNVYEAITSKLSNSLLLSPKEIATTLNGRPIYGNYDNSLHTTYGYEIESPTTVSEDDLIDAAGKHVNQQSVTDLLINA